MPTNDFLPFATAGGANVTAQATYAAAGYVSTGRASGILPSDVYNKIARQSSIAAYLLGQLIVDQLAVDALDNGTVATVLANFKLAIAKTPTLPTVQRFTSGSGTYTPTSANVRRIQVKMCGPGGGGAAQSTNAGSAGSAVTSFGSATAWTAAVGAGGATNGGNGGAGGTGGTDGSVGTLIARFAGGAGFHGGSTNHPTGDTQMNIAGGAGGANPFGGAGAPTSSTGGTAAANTGAGGAGAMSSGSTNPAAGGGAGEYVEFLVNTPTAVPYVVGTGGAGGPTGGVAGGAGANGFIQIIEYYS